METKIKDQMAGRKNEEVISAEPVLLVTSIYKDRHLIGHGAVAVQPLGPLL